MTGEGTKHKDQSARIKDQGARKRDLMIRGFKDSKIIHSAFYILHSALFSSCLLSPVSCLLPSKIKEIKYER